MTFDDAIQLGLEHHQRGELPQAEAIYRQVLEQAPDSPDALNLLGAIQQQRGNHAIARELLRRAVALAPSTAPYYGNLGAACRSMGLLDEALAAHRRAVELAPAIPDLHDQLGVTLIQLGRGNEAIACFQKAVQLNPGGATSILNLGNALFDASRFTEAVPYLREAIRLRPDGAPAFCRLGMALKAAGQLDESIAAFAKAAELDPLSAGTLGGLGISLRYVGRLDEAIRSFARAVQLRPDDPALHSELLFTFLFSPRFDPARILREHRAWAARHTDTLAQTIAPHTNSRAAGRRLRIGYLSSNFSHHVVGLLIAPALARHDRNHFEVFCYSDVTVADEVTAQLQAHADIWRSIARLNDVQLAELIRQDAIDILIDLNLHMHQNRLLALARKPAPVQATYLAYCGTSGMRQMDYVITDPYLNPRGTEAYYSETLARLPRTYWCYNPSPEAPDVVPLPCVGNGFVTFSSMNVFAKVNAEAARVWARILSRVPGSKLRVVIGGGPHGNAAARAMLEQNGIAPDRLEFLGYRPRNEYLAVCGDADIALDTFPYNGGTTSMDLLWMGVPVITLAGVTGVGRAGVSLLSNVGLTELIAADADAYVEIAVRLANNPDRLATIRSGLRGRMRGSPLCDSVAFARDLESVYTQMWARWLKATS